MAWSKKQTEIVFITPVLPRRKLEELTIQYITSDDSILSLQLNLGHLE
jgi:hypothetical protein